MKKIYFIVLAILVIIYMFYSIRKNRLSIANSFMWILFCIGLLLLSIFPKSLDWLADFMGISYPPALFLSLAVIILFIQNFVFSKKIEDLHKRIINISQELSIVKSEKNKGKK